MGLRGTNQEFGRPYNRRIVLEAIRANGPTTRGRIADEVGLTVQTVSTIIRELAEQGYILSEKEEPRGRGLPPTTLRINPEGGYAIGIHVSPLGIDAALVDLAGAVIGSTRRDAAQATPDEGFTLIRAMVAELRALRPGARMLGAGLALPGPFDVDSMSFVGPTTMAGWGNVLLRERLAEVSGLPAFIETDMAAAAHGESLYGRGADFSDFYYLFLGAGLGGIMVHEGVAQRGAWGNAGEIGHIPVVPDGEPCPCGNRGCLERYVSLDAFARQDLDAARWVAGIRPQLHAALTTIENLFDPETIILGGLVPPRLAAELTAAAVALPNSVSARRDRKAPRLVVATGGPDTVLLGAAALAVAGVLSPRFGQLFTPGRDQMKGIAA
ncbi:MAG: ROK family transcriptional regulator [Devosia sp.]|uniref:ROK family transcriptional regulator n=1 Tax=Devosia sp. TaxID=1871048 RepID=UPI001AD2D0ED|nr:ROK family transcriptional regulator [Devosia sp.]MBN9315393.1 ROK family transcriptional regulator [Devosia sp.]